MNINGVLTIRTIHGANGPFNLLHRWAVCGGIRSHAEEPESRRYG